MSFLKAIGERFLGKWRFARQVTAIAWSVLCLAFQPRYWTRVVREQLCRQIVFTGVDALRLTIMIAVLTGISVVTQAQLQLSKFGQTEMLGPILVIVIIREIAPLLVSFVIIGRSGTAMATELASMRVREEVGILEAQGLDATVYLVMPRVLSIVISSFCLAIVFVTVSFVSGYLFGSALGASGDPTLFMQSVFRAMTRADIGNFLAKIMVPGLLIGVICCREGLQVRGVVTEVPQAATRAVVSAIAAVLIVSAVVSVLTYV